MNDILLGKAEIIERALARAERTYAAHVADLENNLDAQDVIVPNLQRVCEAAIDMAMHLVRIKQLGLHAGLAGGAWFFQADGAAVRQRTKLREIE